MANAQVNLALSVWDSVVDGTCRTTITFLSKKEYLLESRDQMVTKAYKFSQHRKTDFYLFFQRTTANNDLPSCTGVKAAKVGSRLKFYAKFNPSMTEMYIYPKPNDDSKDSVRYRKRGT